MREIKTRSHYGAHLTLDQCPVCGGLWFDDLELYDTAHGVADELDGVDVEKLKTPTYPPATPMHCPRDGQELVAFRDRNFPVELQLESCRRCGGFWFNRGEFRQYQEHRAKRRAAAARPARGADDELSRKIDALLRASGEGSEMSDTLGQIGAFLSTPMNPVTRQPLDLTGGQGAATPAQADRAVSTVAALVRALLQFFLR